MKKNLLIPAVIVLSALNAGAQNTPVTTPTTPVTTTTNTWDASKNPTVAAILNKYENPDAMTKTSTAPVDVFPALGQFELNGNSESLLHITQDATNKGLVMIEGLPEGTLKAYLRRSPATYSIPAQKNADGKMISEGTLIYDPETNELNICLGKSFQDADPALVFQEPAQTEVTEKTVVKSKSGRTASAKKPAAPKPVFYKGKKLMIPKETAAN